MPDTQHRAKCVDVSTDDVVNELHINGTGRRRGTDRVVGSRGECGLHVYRAER